MARRSRAKRSGGCLRAGDRGAEHGHHGIADEDPLLRPDGEALEDHEQHVGVGLRPGRVERRHDQVERHVLELVEDESIVIPAGVEGQDVALEHALEQADGRRAELREVLVEEVGERSVRTARKPAQPVLIRDRSRSDAARPRTARHACAVFTR